MWGRKVKNGIDDPQTSTVDITQGAHAVDHVFGEVRDGDAVGETDGESEVAAVGGSIAPSSTAWRRARTNARRALCAPRGPRRGTASASTV